MPKAILFDIDGVLLDSFEANLKFFQDLMIFCGYLAPSRAEYPALFHLSLPDLVRTVTGLSDEAEVARICELAAKRAVPYPDELLKTSDNLEAIIAELSKKYILGIVTSRIKNSVYSLDKLADLEKYFQVTITYEDTEKHKPDPEPLLLAAQRLGINSEEIVYIGDVITDVQAAHSAGMKAIAYSQIEIETAEAWVKDFAELPRIIESL